MIKQFGSRITDPNQVAFHLWAPLAIQVDVVGEFNNWTENHSILTNAGNGYWEGTINNIGEGDKYKYVIHRNNGVNTLRIDPATRDTVDSDTNNALNHGIIINTDFNWTPFKTPAFENMIIYQCHIGSFCGRNDGLHRNNFTATFQDLISKLDYRHSLGIGSGIMAGWH